jgi:hypothetical protein
MWVPPLTLRDAADVLIGLPVAVDETAVGVSLRERVPA